MQKPLLFSILILTLFSTACTKYTLMPYQDKILGEWRFDKVMYHESFSLNSADYTSEYRNTTFSFYRDGSLVSQDNGARGQTLNGYWVLIKDTYIDEDGDRETEYQLQLVLHNTATNRDESYLWCVSSITGNKLRATEKADGGTYRYVMQRL